MVKSIEQIPGTISRSSWEISVDGHLVHDWVTASYRESRQFDDHNSEIYVVEAKIGVPLLRSKEEDMLSVIMSMPGGHRVEFICTDRSMLLEQKQELPRFVVVDALPVSRELQGLSMQGTQIEGLDARSDWPVIQVVTFLSAKNLTHEEALAKDERRKEARSKGGKG